MSYIICQFNDDGRTGAAPYSLAIVEHPRALERYEVRCTMTGASAPAWAERFTTLQAACKRWVDELLVMAKDYDDNPELPL